MKKNKEIQRDGATLSRKRFKLKLPHIIILFIILAVILWVVWGNVTVRTSNFIINDPSLPAAFDGYKIAHVSDLHNANFGHDNSVLVKILYKNAPDIICITGDLVDSSHTDLERAVSFARQAVQIAPCYYVTGNHEAWLEEEYGSLERKLKECGVIILHNQYVDLTQGSDAIRLTGIDDTDFKRNDGLGLFEAVPLAEGTGQEPQFEILLSHRPELFETYVRNGYNVVLSGHAHGGQFRIPFVGGLVAPSQGFFPKYDSGIYSKEKTAMVVSRGIGNSIIPVRINNNPEIIIITFHSDLN